MNAITKLVFFNSMCELASEFSETRIHANPCELKRELLLADGTKDNRLFLKAPFFCGALADGTKDNRLKIWENYYHVVFLTVHKKEP